VKEAGQVIAKALGGADNFSARSRFSRFLKLLLGMVSESAAGAPGPEWIGLAGIWSERVSTADSSVGIYNQTPALALNRLFIELTRDMTAHFQERV
jgi:hypothetical protein